jgi:hypothetical protein
MTYSPNMIQDFLSIDRVWTGLRLSPCIGLPTVGASCYGTKVETDNYVVEHVLVALQSLLLWVSQSLDPVFSLKTHYH